MVCLLLFVLAAGPAFAQRFPIRHLGSIGHLEGKQTVSLGSVRATNIHEDYALLDGRDRAGKPWRAWMRTFGGIVDTVVWTADFDRNGQQDLLIARHFAANGWCPAPVDVVILLFDGSGRPVPWKIHSQLPPSPENERWPPEPIVTMDSDRDGRAEFVSIGCASPFENPPLGQKWIDGVYAASDARLDVVKAPSLKSYRARVGGLNARPAEWRDLRGAFEAKPWERIDSIATAEYNCEEFQPPRSPLPAPGPGQHVALVAVSSPCAATEKAEVITAGRRETSWPEDVVIDGPEGRDIRLEDATENSSEGLRSILRNGYPARWLGDGLLWADASRPSPSQLRVSLDIAESRKRVVDPLPVADGCREFHPRDDSRFRLCLSGLWKRFHGSTEEELLPDRVSIKTSHSAMGVTHSGVDRFEQPPGAGTMIGASDGLTQWSGPDGPRFAMHENGRLTAWRVEVPVKGQLVDTLVFANPVANGRIELTEVRGRFRWRRIE